VKVKHRKRFLTAIAVGGLTAGLCAGAAGSAAAGTSSTNSSARTTTAAHAASSARSARALAAARAELEHLKVGLHATDHRLPSTGLQAFGHRLSLHASSISTFTLRKSRNWSGFADDNTQGNTYTQVGAHWTEPAVICGSSLSLVTFWVGLDGLNSGTVEQVGTGAECYQGNAYYYTWWEMYPTNAEQVVGLTVSPGDSIDAQVVDEGGGNYSLEVTDQSNPADSFSTTQSCAAVCADASAEWVAEAPSGSNGVFPLADYQSWSVSGATATSGSQGTVTSFPYEWVFMFNLNTGDLLSYPAGYPSGGNFTTTWLNSS
jgi:putative intracellular protease/amidase